MSLQIIPNSGLLGSDFLENLRVAALISADADPIPGPIANYIEALENSYINLIHERRKLGLKDISFTRRATKPVSSETQNLIDAMKKN